MGEWDLHVTVENGQYTSRTFKAEGPLDALRQADTIIRDLLIDFGIAVTKIKLTKRGD